MQESEKFAIASRLHVQLRRKTGRITDVEWMVKNNDYAEEILRLAREQHDDEMTELATRFETSAHAKPAASIASRVSAAAAALVQPAVAAAAAAPAADDNRYIKSLR